MNNNIEGNNNTNVFNTIPNGVNTINNVVDGSTPVNNSTVNNIPVINESVTNDTQSENVDNNAIVEEKNTMPASVENIISSTDENTLEIGEKFLPIGTVVMLKGGKKRAMITGFCSVLKEDNKKMYDYSGCIYPEGFFSSEMVCLFNHEQIEKVYYKGLIDEEEVKFKSDLNSLLKQMKEENLTIDDLNKMAEDALKNETNDENSESNVENSNISKESNNASSAIPEMPN